ncbi:hypothetical protein C922_00878 [Plasmodium inui San Antonio 1]|uniref:Uncharacterized protein n=1 Tax=Plasmodium inui San Antonio 1 TaxID=1237626 RepID=W7A5Q3_9APIC|nr:hypothetical protein C922_00878 [Plasmodium inui San Antonio 1]EUD68482.1 hypothetical protein C922_00878 [Plasmodium inui San Antonio 1]
MRVHLLCATLGVYGAATSAALSTEPLQSSVDKGSLFIRRPPRKHEAKVSKKWKSNVTTSRGEDTHKRSSRGAAVVSTLESPIVGVPVGVPLDAAQHGEHGAEENGGMAFLSPVRSNRKEVTLSLRKQTGKRHFNCTKLNNILCMQFLPNISNAYLRYVLEKFSANDLPVKENILFHLILRYLRERSSNLVGGKTSERDSQLINIIEDNAYKFIADHARVIKKCAKRKKHNEVHFERCRTEEGRAKETTSSPPPSDNKIINAYLKMRKKFNIIFVSIKSERNIYRMFRKIKRNISFYDFLDRLAILSFFHRHAQHRFVLHFFKRYIFSLKNENNLFVINFVNTLGERSLLKRYMLIPQLTYHAILHTPVGFDTCADSFKWSFLPVNACNYVESYMRERFFLGGATRRGVRGDGIDRSQLHSGRVESGRLHAKATFLIYSNLLDSLTQKRNEYFPELFLKQFCLYYSEKENILYDNKWHYFLITVSSLMKAHYVRRKLHIMGDAHKGANPPLLNRVNIHDDDIFRDKTHCLITCGGNRLNSQVVTYLRRQFHAGELHRGETLKQYSLLLLLQYTFLLELNLEEVNLVSRNSANHFSNTVENKESAGKKMKREGSGTEHKSASFKKQGAVSAERERLLVRISLLYKSILSSHCEHTGETILLYNYTFQELTRFVQNYLADLVEKCFHGGREVAEEMKLCVKYILPLCRVNPRLFFMLLECLNEGSNVNMARHLWLGSKQTLRNLQPWVRKAIAGELLEGAAEGGGSQRRTREGETHQRQPHQGDTHQGEPYDRMATDRGDPPLALAISAYDAVQTIYKQITSCYDKAHIKNLIRGLLSLRSGMESDPSPLGIFKRPILALNLKQIFFLFVTLNYFNLHGEIIQLFRHIMGSAALGEVFRRAISKRGNHHPSIGDQHIDEEEHELCQKILYIYCNSSFCVDSPLRLPAGVTCSRGLMKYVLFYRDPLHIFNHLIRKYERGRTAEGNIEGAYNEGNSNEGSANQGKGTVEEILQKVEGSKFFHEDSLSKFRRSSIFKEFFGEEIYTRVSQKEYTLIFYTLMIDLYKQGSMWDNRSAWDNRSMWHNESTCNPHAGENKTKQSENNPAASLRRLQFIYLHFYVAWETYLKVHKMSKINFLIGAKTFLLLNDVETFQNLLCANRKIVEKCAIFVNSLLNNYVHHCDARMDILQNNLIAPSDMYITSADELIIFNLNHEQVVQRIRPFGDYSSQCKVTLFIDYRKLFPDLINLQFCLTLPFLRSQKVKSFLEENKITLCEKNFWDITDLVIFYGKCLDKRDKIVYFFSKQMSDFSIQKNKLVKDAFVVSRKK